MSTNSNQDSMDPLEWDETIVTNLRAVQERIQSVRGEIMQTRKEREDDDNNNNTDGTAQDVRLVAVSKTKPITALRVAYQAGCRVFGENYVQEMIEKVSQMPDDVSWHFIGALQSNKVKSLLQSVQPRTRLLIETVSSIKLANKLNTVMNELDPLPDTTTKGEEAPPTSPQPVMLKIMIQVNTSGEDTKSGIDATECVTLCQHIVDHCPRLQIVGLMTIGAPGDIQCFHRLRECRNQIQQTIPGLGNDQLELSMGMSDDFETAIQLGSTNVRVGSTIFGARQYPPKN